MRHYLSTSISLVTPERLDKYMNDFEELSNDESDRVMKTNIEKYKKYIHI